MAISKDDRKLLLRGVQTADNLSTLAIRGEIALADIEKAGGIAERHAVEFLAETGRIAARLAAREPGAVTSEVSNWMVRADREFCEIARAAGSLETARALEETRRRGNGIAPPGLCRSLADELGRAASVLTLAEAQRDVVGAPLATRLDETIAALNETSARRLNADPETLGNLRDELREVARTHRLAVERSARAPLVEAAIEREPGLTPCLEKMWSYCGPDDFTPEDQSAFLDSLGLRRDFVAAPDESPTP